MKTGRLCYNADNDRYGILSMDLWLNEGLHCGEAFEVWLNEEWKTDRIEMSFEKEWYLVYSELKGEQLEGLRVRY